MQPILDDHTGNSRLRLVFDDAVVSFDLAANATFEDIARTLGELSNQRYRNPVAIDVILAVPPGSFCSPHIVPTGILLGCGVGRISDHGAGI
jgi:hypothetical protein